MLDTAVNLSEVEVDEIELVSSLCRESFEDFVKEFWSEIIGDELHWNWHMGVICQELQLVAERVFAGLPKLYDLVINVPPGTSKSTLVSIMYPAWMWTRMTRCQFIGASYSFDLAMDLSRKCRTLVNCEKYKKYFPEVEWSDAQDTKQHFVNTKGGWRFAVGSNGQITGFHAHVMVVDDPIDPRKVVSERILNETNRWMRETLPSRATNRDITPMILVMQRLHQNDPTAQMIEGRKRVRRLCLPASCEFPVFPEELKAFYIDDLLDPKRLPRHILTEAEFDQGPFAYAGQYGQSPLPIAGMLFKVDRIQMGSAIVDKCNPIKKTVRFWDKAATQGGGAFSVGVRMSLTMSNHLIIEDVIRVRVDSAAREQLIRKTAELDGKHILIGIEQEGAGGGKQSAEMSVRNLLGWKVEVLYPKGDKTMRADPFSVQVNNGSVYMIEGPWNQFLLQELMHFPESTYKDQVDACSGAFTLLAGYRRKVGALRPKAGRTRHEEN